MMETLPGSNYPWLGGITFLALVSGARYISGQNVTESVYPGPELATTTGNAAPQTEYTYSFSPANVTTQATSSSSTTVIAPSPSNSNGLEGHIDLVVGICTGAVVLTILLVVVLLAVVCTPRRRNRQAPKKPNLLRELSLDERAGSENPAFASLGKEGQDGKLANGLHHQKAGKTRKSSYKEQPKPAPTGPMSLEEAVMRKVTELEEATKYEQSKPSTNPGERKYPMPQFNFHLAPPQDIDQPVQRRHSQTMPAKPPRAPRPITIADILPDPRPVHNQPSPQVLYLDASDNESQASGSYAMPGSPPESPRTVLTPESIDPYSYSVSTENVYSEPIPSPVIPPPEPFNVPSSPDVIPVHEVNSHNKDALYAKPDKCKKTLQTEIMFGKPGDSIEQARCLSDDSDAPSLKPRNYSDYEEDAGFAFTPNISTDGMPYRVSDESINIEFLPPWVYNQKKIIMGNELHTTSVV